MVFNGKLIHLLDATSLRQLLFQSCYMDVRLGYLSDSHFVTVESFQDEVGKRILNISI